MAVFIIIVFLSILYGFQVSWALPYDKIESDLISPNQTFQYTFTNTGTFEYHCQLHPWLMGIIEVNGSDHPMNAVINIPKGAVESTLGVSFTPNHVIITPRSTVIWNNTDTASHTIANIDTFPKVIFDDEKILSPITSLKQIKEQSNVETIWNYNLINSQFYHLISINSSENIEIVNIKSYHQNILINIDAKKDGEIKIQLPLDLIQIRYKCLPIGKNDVPFVVIDGFEIKIKSKTLSGKQFLIEVPVQKGDKQIEIITTVDNGLWAFPAGCPIEFFENAISFYPKKQLEKGILSENVICKDQLQLIFKSIDGSPVCVKPETVTKLIERGWQFSSIDVPKNSDLVIPRGDLFLQQPLTIKGLNKDQIVGEKITFTVKFNGTKYGCYSHPSLWIENSDHQKIWESNTIVELCDPDTTPVHFEKEWKIGDSPLGIPIINSTGYYTLFAEFENDIIQKDFLVKF
jgi:plastocyanin